MKKISKFLSGKGFYLILAFCLIAVGAAGFTAISSSKIPEKNEKSKNASSTSSIVYSKAEEKTESKPQKAVQKNVTNEPKKETKEKTEKKIPVATGFTSPVASGKIIKKFDNKNLQFSSTYNDMRIHLGTDFSAKIGCDVLSCGVGTVKTIYKSDALGKTVEIDHGNGVVIKYCGLAEDITVEQDQTVALGEKLGTLLGCPAECSDEPHLHIEATISGKYTNPEKLLKLN